MGEKRQAVWIVIVILTPIPIALAAAVGGILGGGSSYCSSCPHIAVRKIHTLECKAARLTHEVESQRKATPNER